MVNGALAQQARTAFDGLPDNREAVSGGSSGNVISGTKDGHGRHAQRGGDVHCAGIVGYVERTSCGHFYELGQLGFASHIDAGDSRGRYSTTDGFAKLLFVFGAKDNNIGPQFLRKPNSRLGETLRQPLLRRSKSCAGTDAHDAFAEAETNEMSPAGGCRRSRPR